MSTKSEQLKKLLETMVRNEVRRIVPTLVKEEMLKVMGSMLMESRISPPTEPTFTGNSDKRRELMETQRSAPMFDRASLAEQMGYGDMIPAEGRRRGMITVDSRLDDHGNAIPIDPSRIPAPVLEAMNKDYTDIVKSWIK